MPRLRSLHLDEFDPELRAMLKADQKSEREMRPTSVRAHHPELAKAYVRFMGAVKQHAVLSERLRELLRLRIAFHNQCRSCMAIRYRSAVNAGVDEALVCSLEKPMEAPDLTDAERAALAYADRFANDHLSIDEAMFAELRRHYDDGELVELFSWIAFCVGFGRLGAVLDMTEELPDAFRDRSVGRVTPWAGEPIVVR